ncbi:MAG: vitamin K epoxide reductase family protein [Candidatus Binataceae bacterium]
MLRRDLTRGRSNLLRYRRAIVLLSMAGMAMLAPGTLLQFGIIDHLPDPPLPKFHADEISLSDAAYRLGSPDAPVGMTSFGMNMILAGLGGKDRAARRRWLPIVAAAKASADMGAAAAYVYTMKTKRTWCAYCLATAALQLSIFAVSLPEALAAFRHSTRA